VTPAHGTGSDGRLALRQRALLSPVCQGRGQNFARSLCVSLLYPPVWEQDKFAALSRV